ncbi:hypothetical protein [Kordiimonas sp.]|uniref:hypothetical protein n=1 Tax=Kordiimonas sp. TaxID=1970157 RepID=UPI003A954444
MNKIDPTGNAESVIERIGQAQFGWPTEQRQAFAKGGAIVMTALTLGGAAAISPEVGLVLTLTDASVALTNGEPTGPIGTGTVLKNNVEMGKRGEALTRSRLSDNIAGEQVTIETSTGARSRVDFVTKDGVFVETKTGNAQLTPGQKQLFTDVQNGTPVTPVGRNAENAGLEPGKAVKFNSCTVDRPCP